VTFVTWALASDARLDEAWALMTEANTDPFCSRLTRLSTGVFGLKKAVQFAAIVFSAEEEEPEPVDAADGALAAGDDGAELVVLLLLPHAARPAPMAQASRMQEINLRVFTQTFSSFPLSEAMRFLTQTSAS
jgi:hypothetical protein